ncbi:AbrB/MazE/SpoVT family DNA-binding domain-containing protein [Candidatus Bathyarchaeota archaeon]|nr:AbrB/MazE/SpoVT family DNA-binding domain-containing protein [Candidatus Bathyarchaeota archaeon]
MVRSKKAELTILSEKGQVVIPSNIRSNMGLKPKTKFLVYECDDLVILKKFEEPDLPKELEAMYKRIDQRINKYGELTQDDIENEIQNYRKEKSAKSKR